MTLRRVAVALPLAALVLLNGCATLMAPGKKPLRADSLFARRQLDVVLRQYLAAAVGGRSDLAMDLGLRPSASPLRLNEAIKEDARQAQRVGRLINQIDTDALSPGEYLTLLTARWELDSWAEATAFHWSDFSDLSPATTPIRQSLEIFRRHPVASSADAERLLYFLQDFAFTLSGIRGGLEARAERGYLAPREMVESAIAFLSGLRQLGADGPWRIEGARLTALDSTLQLALERETGRVITDEVLPALDSMVKYLGGTYRPRASARAGLWQYAGGKEHYRYLLRRYSSLDVSPEDAHRIGLAELVRIDSTLAGLRTRQKWLGNANVVKDTLRRAVGLLRPELSAIISDVERAQERISAQLPARFANPWYQAPVIRPATTLESLLWPNGAYLPASGKGTTGTLVLTERWRSPSARLSVAAASYRLLAPGTHLRSSERIASDTLAPFRQLHPNDGFADGWSQYAASLAGEMGMFASALDAYGRLLDEGMAAALLVADTGIHYLGWSTAQARAILARYTLENDAVVDSIIVERVVNTPGQSVAATLGAREMAAMRAWAQRELGRDFDLKAWHSQVLAIGPVPLPIVGSHLEWWLYDVGRRADEAKAAAANAARKKRER